MSRFVAVLSAAVFAFALGGGSGAHADEQIYSYEPASPETRTFTQTGLSFAFERHVLGGTHITQVIQTGEYGAAALKPASENDLGAGGLKTVLGAARPAGSLYRITSGLDGDAFVNAVCPGSERAWLSIGPLDRFQDLKVQAIGRKSGAPESHLCVTLEFTYRNDWKMPPRAPPRVRYPSRSTLP